MPQAYAPMPGYGMPAYAPGMPPPPAPPMMPGFGIPKVTSGKAIGSLVCAGIGLVLGFVCGIGAVAVPVGLVLGFLGIAETGANGTRAGRGLAIAGTICNAVLLVGGIALAVLWFGVISMQQKQMSAGERENVEKDFAVIRTRLREYYDQNNKSLGPGGPVLATHDFGTTSGGPGPGPRPVSDVRASRGTRVVNQLTIDDLVSNADVSSAGRYELVVTGSASATVTYYSSNDNKRHVLKVYDVATDSYSISEE
jgi:hypothetical protein